MKVRSLLVAAALSLSACRLSWHDTNVGAGVTLQPHQHATLRVHTASGRLAVGLRGEGPGGMTWEARRTDGSVVAAGALGEGDYASCRTSDRELTFAFATGDVASTVAYEAWGETGLALDLQIDSD